MMFFHFDPVTGSMTPLANPFDAAFRLQGDEFTSEIVLSPEAGFPMHPIDCTTQSLSFRLIMTAG